MKIIHKRNKTIVGAKVVGSSRELKKTIMSFEILR
jgi:hypothetical protein